MEVWTTPQNVSEHLQTVQVAPMGSVMTAPPAWPLQTRLPLAALPTAPSVARGHVRTVAREWGLADLADTAELLVSELVTNAVQASAKLRTIRTPVVHLWVTSDRMSMILHVWDASGEMPVRRDAYEHDDEDGRGLVLVETLSKDWGAYHKADGKVVWCLVTAEP
jgi:anti-sigma regulatory factor (Ser/Thr protein kinase)